MALVDYDLRLTLREARARYFAVNDFGQNGGYDEPWVVIELGPLPVRIPNTQGRIRAVRYHDLHHVLTGYDTDLRGEFEISAFEIGAGCRDFYAAWLLNTSGTAGGVLCCPVRTFRAFRRGRRSQSLYGAPLDELLEETVSAARLAMALPGETPPVRASDVALFALTTTLGLAAGLLLLSLAVPLTPLAIVHGTLRGSKAANRAT